MHYTEGYGIGMHLTEAYGSYMHLTQSSTAQVICDLAFLNDNSF
jgi:hypothetical protein